MAGISKTGTHTIGILALVTVIGLAAQVVARHQITNPPLPELPPKIGAWTARPGQPMEFNTERDTPPAHYYIYYADKQPTVYVSVARVTTLNSYRAPFSYLFDTDGRVMGNQKTLVSRKNDKTPLRMWAVGIGHDEIAMMQHWVQPKGEDPIPEPTEAPLQVIGTTFLHQPAFVCDVWSPLRNDSKAESMEKAIATISDAIDAQIKAGKAP